MQTTKKTVRLSRPRLLRAWSVVLWIFARRILSFSSSDASVRLWEDFHPGRERIPSSRVSGGRAYIWNTNKFHVYTFHRCAPGWCRQPKKIYIKNAVVGTVSSSRVARAVAFSTTPHHRALQCREGRNGKEQTNQPVARLQLSAISQHIAKAKGLCRSHCGNAIKSLEKIAFFIWPARPTFTYTYRNTSEATTARFQFVEVCETIRV